MEILLHFAYSTGDIKFITILIESKVDFTIKNKNGLIAEEIPPGTFPEILDINNNSYNNNVNVTHNKNNTVTINLNVDSDMGEFFLDTYSDLNKSDSIIYSSVNNLDVNQLRINDRVNIDYLGNELCYKIESINNKVKKDLIIKLVSTNKEYNIFLSRIEC